MVEKSRQSQTRLNASNRAALLDSYAAGVPVKELADRFGVHRATVSELVHRAGMLIRQPGLSEGVRREAARLYEEGLTLPQVAARQVRARRGTIALSHQIIHLALNGPAGSQNKSSEPEMLWFLIEDIFTAGDATPTLSQWEHITGRSAPAPALLTGDTGPRPAPEFVEWLMGLEAGWVTDTRHGLSPNQQIAALGNGVLPLQAVAALTNVV